MSLATVCVCGCRADLHDNAGCKTCGFQTCNKFRDIETRITTLVENQLAQVKAQSYQEGFIAGFERREATAPDTLAATISVLLHRNGQLHADKHELRMRPCHNCGAYPKIP